MCWFISLEKQKQDRFRHTENVLEEKTKECEEAARGGGENFQTVMQMLHLWKKSEKKKAEWGKIIINNLLLQFFESFRKANEYLRQKNINISAIIIN